MNEFLSEAIGTFILILFGLGVNAGSSLNNSFSNKISNSWVMGTFGWGLAVTLGVYAAKFSGAHINPAVTIGLLTSGEISSIKAFVYIFGQITGAFIGCIIIFLHYLPLWEGTKSDKILGVFATSPSKPSKWSNLLSEIIGTFILLFGLKFIGTNEFSDGLNPLIVGLLVCAIGISLGGTTGYAINPVRDFIPRLVHYILPIPGKGNSNWSYSWIPVIGPIIGGVMGVSFFLYLFEGLVTPYFIISFSLFILISLLSYFEFKT
tara:strand:- start:789 stop:1577 length:789 start_codon:yes stop_codon:yes gene_type:complete